MSLPELGVGFVYLPGLEAFSESVARSVEVLEVEPQTFWSHSPPTAGGAAEPFRVNREALERLLRIDRPILVHSVGYPVGGSSDGDPRHLAALRETFDLLKPVWWSDHASLLTVDDERGRRHLGFLMPPEQSVASAAAIADRIRRLQDGFGLPFAFETGVSYLRPLPGALSDGDFWAEIAERADCGILLDVHNVWTNALNGRQDLASLAERLPLERVWEIHVAGGQWHKGYWLDSHSGLPPADLLETVSALVPRLPSLCAITLEIIPDQIEAQGITEADLALCLSELRAIWQSRASAAGPGRTTRSGDTGGPTAAAGVAMQRWERDLEAALSGDAAAVSPLAADPGIDIYRDLIGMARRGTLVEALPLSMRYLHRALGPDLLESAFMRFWRSASPEPFASDEALNFAAFARSELQLPHLDELIAFELASHRAAMTGLPQLVSFSCRPEPLLAALKSGTALTLEPANVEVEVTPPAPAVAA